MLTNGTSEYYRLKDELAGHLPVTLRHYNKYISHASKLQILLSFVLLCLSALADSLAFSEGSLRLFGIIEVIGIYLAISGILGMAAALSYRRGLTITTGLMHVHTLFVGVPITIISSVLMIVAHNKQCTFHYEFNNYGLSSHLQCGIDLENPPVGYMHYISLVGDIRIDIGLVVLGIVQLFISVFMCIMCMFCVCESYGLVNERILNQITKATTLSPEKCECNSNSCNVCVITQEDPQFVRGDVY